ncbi:MAG: hypothetical protein IJM30_08090 [Thermoguttaceae bacterium]|nr:hypothetical protein [Thermoguttaceae bacterium]
MAEENNEKISLNKDPEGAPGADFDLIERRTKDNAARFYAIAPYLADALRYLLSALATTLIFTIVYAVLATILIGVSAIFLNFPASRLIGQISLTLGGGALSLVYIAFLAVQLFRIYKAVRLLGKRDEIVLAELDKTGDASASGFSKARFGREIMDDFFGREIAAGVARVVDQAPRASAEEVKSAEDAYNLRAKRAGFKLEVFRRAAVQVGSKLGVDGAELAKAATPAQVAAAWPAFYAAAYEAGRANPALAQECGKAIRDARAAFEAMPKDPVFNP